MSEANCRRNFRDIQSAQHMSDTTLKTLCNNYRVYTLPQLADQTRLSGQTRLVD